MMQFVKILTSWRAERLKLKKEILLVPIQLVHKLEKLPVGLLFLVLMGKDSLLWRTLTKNNNKY